MTDFAANPEDDSCFFMIGTKLIKCANKKLEVVCETTYQMWHYGEYFIARGTRGNEYHFYHYPTQNLSTETHNFDIKSAYRNAKFTYIITGDKKLIQLQGSNKLKEVPINFESEVKIVHADDYNVLVVAAAKDAMGNLETFVHAFDNEMRLLASNRFSLREVSDFKLSNFNIIPATETTPSYLIMNYVGANMPIILRKSGDGKYTQPKIFNLHLPGVTTFNELRTLKQKVYIGTGRKIYESTLLEKEVTEDADKPVKPTKETPIILTAVYLDKMSRFKQVGIDTKEMGADVLLSRVVLKSDTPEHLFISKNDPSNKTNILRYNFNTQSELAVVKEVSKLDRKGYLVDFVVNQANRINAIDDNGFYYHEAANDLMVLTDLMTFGRRNNFNFSRSRQIATNFNKDKGYLVTDDGGAILEVDLLQENTYRALKEDLYGILEIKVTKNDVIFGVRQVLNKSGRLDYILFKYDIATQKLVDEGNMNLPLGYHFEAIRLVDDKKVLVVANKRRDNDSKSGTSGEMVFALFNTNLEREFMSADTPVGNKFGVSNVIEVLAVLEGFPVIMVSKAATLYLYAIETDSKIKLVDSIHFSNADDENSSLVTDPRHHRVSMLPREQPLRCEKQEHAAQSEILGSRDHELRRDEDKPQRS